MRFFTTGFTTKSWNVAVGPESRGIKDLSLVLPEALIEMGHQVFSFKDTSSGEINQNDILLVKLWDPYDPKYATHTPELILKLSECNINTDNILLISDHHDIVPAYEGLRKLARTTFYGSVLLKNFYSKYILENRFRLHMEGVKSQPTRKLAIDPSPYVLPDFMLEVSKPHVRELDFKQWVHGSLSYSDTHKYDTDLDIAVYKNISSLGLCQQIARNRLYIMPEHSHNEPNWWRPNYLMGIAGRAACYASKRDQLAIFGAYFPLKYIENNYESVQEWQNQQLKKELPTKEQFKGLLNQHLCIAVESYEPIN